MVCKTDLIHHLGLIPHPEGGYFAETYRSGATPMASKGATDATGALMATDRSPPERNVQTSIYYMLDSASPQQWLACNHSPHVHYWHAGGPITYHLIHPDGWHETQVLGPDVTEGQVMQLAVAGGVYKAAQLQSGADYGLLGEAVAPG